MATSFHEDQEAVSGVQAEHGVLSGENDVYISEMYSKYILDPASVDSSWQRFFARFGTEEYQESSTFEKERRGATWSPRLGQVMGSMPESSFSDTFTSNDAYQFSDVKEMLQYMVSEGLGTGASQDSEKVRQATLDTVRALMLIRSFRMRGHLEACLDPLELTPKERFKDLDPATYGFSPKDYDRPIFINHAFGLETATLSQILDLCRKTYANHVGIEFAYVVEPAERSWLQKRVENTLNRSEFSDKGKKTILERLTEADLFESFLHKKFGTLKRFGLDGGESLVPMLEQIFKRGCVLGIEDIVIGMAHRGRLNVLANLMHKPYRQIFAEFKRGTTVHEDVGSGDVKYHLGASADRFFGGEKVHLSLIANPSHLECVNTVVLGKVRAKQQAMKDAGRVQSLGLLLHGDAAFIGQGVVAETFLLSELAGYRTGGTIHVAINNQIGFTTMPSESRSSPYCSDMAKTIGAPVFHVNGDDPEACLHVARLAMEYRQTFHKDVVIDMWCYRRHGHNESDEPMFTQPLMYKKIEKHPKVRDSYARRLESEGVIEKGEAERIAEHYRELLEKEFIAADTYRENEPDWMGGAWAGLSTGHGSKVAKNRFVTGISKSAYKKISKALVALPDDFHIHRSLDRQLKKKAESLNKGQNIDWGTAEALAFGSLLLDGYEVRLSGEDSQRGTFSQRHAVLVDQNDEHPYIPLNHIDKKQKDFCVIDSPLSEFGLLGFEYGYALESPLTLVVWEAQFGDFANGAQVIIDQFVVSGESKWLRACGLVMLLPHGFEGQGPEHSSARLERYLQLCAEDNVSVCNISTPANYFHALRRQMCRDFRKPLIIMSPKSLLRHPLCLSQAEDLQSGTVFSPVLPDHAESTLAQDKDIKRVVCCSGKVYYDLLEERQKREIKDIYLLRVEELYPYPQEQIVSLLKRFVNAGIIWCQEEPENAGAWSYIDRKLSKDIASLNLGSLVYVGREAAASPATGSKAIHDAEQADLVNRALMLS